MSLDILTIIRKSNAVVQMVEQNPKELEELKRKALISVKRRKPMANTNIKKAVTK